VLIICWLIFVKKIVFLANTVPEFKDLKISQSFFFQFRVFLYELLEELIRILEGFNCHHKFLDLIWFDYIRIHENFNDSA
jgi:hypothetical protein